MTAETKEATVGVRGGPAVFEERLNGLFAPDVYRFAVPLLVAALICLVAGAHGLGYVFAALGLFTTAFFRNPRRTIPSAEGLVVAPADGRVVAVGEVEGTAGEKVLRIGIFLSIFNVHVNRAPVAGRVVAVERSGNAFLAAFNPEAENRNVRCAVTLELPDGRRVDVVQITGLIARRIICQPVVGEWLERGVRYGLIRFGSRTDVLLPLGSECRVERGDRVRGGSSILAMLSPAGGGPS